MDQIKTGKFIARLRSERGLTQEQLGERLGVTNKTVSRWETGTYMPPIEALEVLSKELDVSINEIIAGERLSDESFRKRADENIAQVLSDSAFTLRERQEYFKKRWVKSHIFLYFVLAAVVIAAYILIDPIVGALITPVGLLWLSNSQQAYIERKTFDSPKD